MFEEASFADLPAFLCGHAQDDEAATGCTVVVAPEGAVCGVDVRGGAPATRETDLLRPENMVQKVNAVVLSGGSAFGLAASTGVMDELASRGIGFAFGGLHVPIVVGASLFDLGIGKPSHPDAAMGAAAARAAFEAGEGTCPAEGNVGAGAGATVGKFLSPGQATKTGVGVFGLRAGEVVAVALVVVNALGTVCDEHGRPLAGCRRADGTVMEPLEPLGVLAAQTQTQPQAASQADGVKPPAPSAEGESPDAPAASDASAVDGPCANTTLGVVLTNAKMDKAQACKASSIVHDAYARAIKPVHSSNDGDTVFTMASGKVEAPFDLVAILATEAMQRAVERAATQARASHGLPAALVR